jgi:hypothetical protein
MRRERQEQGENAAKGGCTDGVSKRRACASPPPPGSLRTSKETK